MKKLLLILLCLPLITLAQLGSGGNDDGTVEKKIIIE